MNRLSLTLLATWVSITPALQGQPGDNFGRDSESIYMADLSSLPAVELDVLATTAAYAVRSLNSHIGNFAKGEKVTLVAVHTRALLVKGRIEGWVRPEHLTKLDPELLDKIRTESAREAAFREAVGKKEVVPGMAFSHVIAALGEPSNKSSRVDETGRYDLWSYTLYRRELQRVMQTDPQTGQLITTSRYVDVPDGSIDIEFTSGIVTAVETNRLTPNRRLRMR